MIPFDIATRKQIRIHGPEGWLLTDVPEDVALESEFGKIEGTYRLEQGTLVIDQRLSLKKARAEKDKFADLVTILGTRSKLAIPHLFFEPE